MLRDVALAQAPDHSQTPSSSAEARRAAHVLMYTTHNIPSLYVVPTSGSTLTKVELAVLDSIAGSKGVRADCECVRQQQKCPCSHRNRLSVDG